MNCIYLKRFFLVISGIVFLLLIQNSLLFSQSFVREDVANTDASPQKLFEFNTPLGSTGTDRVIIAKFVVDLSLGNLQFRLNTPIGSKYTAEDFEIEGLNSGNQLIIDPDLSEPDNVVATLRVRDLSVATPPEVAAPGYRIIKISIKYKNDYVFGASEKWELLAAQPTTSTLHYWGFWNEGTGESTVEATVTRPKLIEYVLDVKDFTNPYTDFPTTKNFEFGEIHINLNDALTPEEPYQFINVGTQTLDMVSVNPALIPAGPYSVVNYPGSASDILPLAAFTGTIFKCKPSSLGPVPDVNISILVNSTVISVLNINLIKAVGIRLNTALLLDLSGSMLCDVYGNCSFDANSLPTNPEDVRKIWKAREAGRLLKDLYRDLLPSGRMSLFTYPDINGVCPSASIPLGGFQEVSSNHPFIDGYLNNGSPTRVAPISNDFLTPMAEGINKVYNTLPRGEEYNRSIVFMIGDGQHSCNSSPPNKTPQDWENELRTARIKFYTIPYGDNNASWTQQLKDISNWTNGVSYPVNITDDLDLRKSHENAIRDALDLEQITDPEGNISRNQKTSHSVCISQDVYTLTFIVRWESDAVNAISLTLITPEGESITPLTAQTSPNNVSYFSSQSYLGYVVRGHYLEGRNGTGLWQLNLKGGNSLGATQQVRYSYSVYAQTTLKTEFYLEDFVFVGDRGRCILTIGDENHPIMELSSSFEYRVPEQSFGTYLATTSIDPKLVFEAPDTINGKVTSLADKKYYALQNFVNQPYNPAICTVNKELTQNKSHLNIGQKQLFPTIVTADLDCTMIAGNYEFVAKVSGITIHGDCFEREITANRWMKLKMTPETIFGKIEYRVFEITPFFPKELVDTLQIPIPSGFIRQNVVFTPVDDFGNYLGPGNANEITMSSEIGEFIGGIVDNLDGSYIRIIEYRKGTTPEVIVTAQGVTAPPKSPPPVEETKRLFIVPFAGWFNIDNKLPVDANIVYGIRFGYNLLQSLDLEAEAGITSTKDTIGTKGTILQANISALYNFAEVNNIKTFARIGAGLVNFNKFINTGSAFTVNGGIGAYYNIASSQFTFRADIGDYIIFDDPFNSNTTHNWQATLGVVFRF